MISLINLRVFLLWLYWESSLILKINGLFGQNMLYFSMNKIKKFLETAEATIFVRSNKLKKRNIIVQGNRTSVTLEPQIWVILHDVAEDHDCTIHELCDMIYEFKNENSSLASAIRIFLISYLHIKLKQGQ